MSDISEKFIIAPYQLNCINLIYTNFFFKFTAKLIANTLSASVWLWVFRNVKVLTTTVCFNLIGPNNNHPFRALGIGQRPFLDQTFSSHLRDLETFRRKVPAITSISASNSNTAVHSTTNGLISSDCQGYKPNAPQISGKLCSIRRWIYCRYPRFISYFIECFNLLNISQCTNNFSCDFVVSMAHFILSYCLQSND